MESWARQRWTLIAVCATTFMLLVDITIVVVALPSIQRAFGAGLSGLQWVVDAYTLTLAAVILTAGALADRYGRRAVFVTGVVVFTLGSLLCGLAWNIAVLDVARAIQALGGAALFATALALIGHEFRGPARFGALAAWGATVGAAVACGPLFGGILTDLLGWRWIFYVNIPVGIFALVVALTRIVESRDENARRTDVAGLLTFAASLFLIVYGIIRGNALGWTSASIVATLAGGVALMGAFVVVELRQTRPMLDVTLFRRRSFVGISLATFCIAAGMFGLLPYLSIYLQDLRGLSPLGAGLRFLPMTAFVFIVPIATRRLAARTPLWVMVTAGFALVSVGLVLMRLLVSSDSSWTRLLPGLIVAGVGIGLSNPALAAGALRVVDPARTGMASGINNTFRIGGVAIGVAALGALLENRIAASLTSTAQGDLHSLANVVSSRGVRGVAAHVSLVRPARVAFVGAFGDLLVVGAVMLAVGAVVASTTLRERKPVPAAAATEPAA